MKKLRTIILSLALAMLLTVTAAAAGTQAVGDVNGDGTVNTADMQRLYELLSSGSLTDEDASRADVNGNGELSFHWSAVYDEDGAQIRTYYDVKTGDKSSIEKWEYDEAKKAYTITQYDVQTEKKNCVSVYDVSDESSWVLIKETYYDGDGNVTSEEVH